ncbi:hypothetical protein D5018_14165 [Parashewanella curva]|uniref:Uncharacterized protein n=1 Tax=Parashewanella curva TaxID=2338552 RepID=A0A3L8PWN4_9GAMM|nr:hypothetical protein [Parashewanella curva]RLV59033.1 hypothetical protein D5018_14165 [Parashewanella curva]
MKLFSKFMHVSLLALSGLTCSHLWAAEPTQCKTIPSVVDDGNADGSVEHPFLISSMQEIDITNAKAGDNTYFVFNKNTKDLPAYLAAIIPNPKQNITIEERKNCPPTQDNFDVKGMTVFKSNELGRILLSYVEDTKSDSNYWFKVHANTDVSGVGFLPMLQDDSLTLQDVLNFQK